MTMHLNLDQQWELVGWVRVFVFFALPILAVFVPLQGKTLGKPIVRLLLAGLVAWPCFSYFEVHFAWPIAQDLAQLRGDPFPDGPNTVGPMILFGWIMPLLVGLFAVLIRFLFLRLFMRKNPLDTP